MAKSAISTPTATTPGHRLVPARIARQTVYVECPAWCIVDHVAEPESAVEDITHASDTSSIVTTSMVSRGVVSELYAAIKSDPASTDPRLRAAHVVVDEGIGEDAHMSPELAEAFADELIGFASEVRRLARIASLANGVADSDPSMNEALRRVRGA
ncbi:hypothetical protein ABZ916_39750 [Streptomyces sp. NPDC046853]|uniref:DUF6907 domain-containing protein n=1 Tax=Streptomyces sp. NPDC046853 TaxID=3154920 RepID=UPI0033F64C5B